MSKKSSLVSRTFFRRPAVRDLAPDLKLILICIAVSCESHTGVYIPGGLCDDTGLQPAALNRGLEDLEKRKLIKIDKETGEVFLSWFYRDNTFKGSVRAAQWVSDFKQIESELLKKEVLDAVLASPECLLCPSLLNADNSNKDNNQILSKQDKDKGEGEELEKPAAANQKSKTLPPPGGDPCPSGALEAVEIEKWLESLMAAGARTQNPNHGADLSNCAKLRELCDVLTLKRVLRAAAGEIYPGTALKACKKAGLLDEADKLKAEQLRADSARAYQTFKQKQDLANAFAMDPATCEKGTTHYLLSKKPSLGAPA